MALPVPTIAPMVILCPLPVSGLAEASAAGSVTHVGPRLHIEVDVVEHETVSLAMLVALLEIDVVVRTPIPVATEMSD